MKTRQDLEAAVTLAQESAREVAELCALTGETSSGETEQGLAEAKAALAAYDASHPSNSST